MEEKKYSWQECQDEAIVKEFRELHVELVNKVIAFCKKNNIDIDEFNLSADGISFSIPHGEWTPATDSSFSMRKFDNSEPFLWSC